MTTRVRADIRGLVYAGGKIPRMGFARTADSFATDGVIDAAAFQDAMGGEGDLQGTSIYRPNQTDPNRIKTASVISGSKLTHQGPAYTDALTDLVYEIVGRLHPDVFNECIRLALRNCYFLYSWPLGWQVDNDFATTAIDGTGNSWDWQGNAVAMTTVAKSTTGGVYTQVGQTGPRNLVLTGSGAGNGYTKSSQLTVEPGQALWHGGIGRANGAYTASYVLWDVSNGAALETITFQSRAFQRLGLQTMIPPGCRLVEQRIGNVEASGVTEWDCLFGHVMGDESRQLILPPWLVKRWQFISFGPADYFGRQNARGLWNATGRMVQMWYPRLDYQGLVEDSDASLSTLQINKPVGLHATDFWITAKRPHSDIEDLSDEADQTTADEDYLMPAVYDQVSQALMLEDPGEPRWPIVARWAQEALALEQIVRATAPPETVRTLRRIGLRTNG